MKSVDQLRFCHHGGCDPYRMTRLLQLLDSNTIDGFLVGLEATFSFKGAVAAFGLTSSLGLFARLHEPNGLDRLCRLHKKQQS